MAADCKKMLIEN